MSDKIFKLLQAFKTNSSFQSNAGLKYLFEPFELEMEKKFEISKKELENDMFDVTVNVSIQTRNKETKDVAYNVSVSYSGIFEISNLDDNKELDKVIRTYCCAALYPYCRSAICHIISDSPFQSITIQPLDFFAIYNEQESQKKDI